MILKIEIKTHSKQSNFWKRFSSCIHENL